ncbi:unnamed protein product [Paramecium octaurelia]|uniref:Uncharacterized protein n=1 Tax=Paramecium octaurelia TaxID=43137 RepID=A0A8S1S0P8_PAROT|nr:unnamed protein product [Paramecium octaurelia]
MSKLKMIENEKDFCCCQRHKLPVVSIVLDPKLSRNQRLLCTECIENTDFDAKVVGLKKMISLIEEAQLKKMEKVEYVIVNQIELIEQLYSMVNQMKSFAIQQFDQQFAIINEWIKNLQQQRSEQSHYSFYEELENIVMKQIKADDYCQQFIHKIKKKNNCWTSKLYPKLELFKAFVEYKKCKEVLSNLDLSSENLAQNQQQQQIKIKSESQLNYEKQELLQKSEIKFKLIDQSVKQNQVCKSIVFDSSGSIMVSTQNNDIIVWSLINGTIKLVKTLSGHTSLVQCLVASKKQNSFISCSLDKTIRCWQSQNYEWNSSQPYQKHTDYIMCIILSSNEDLLFSGSDDKSIKVWKVDFNQNKLTFLYSLDKHNNRIMSLSLNQSENQLVSCASSQNQIIIWERREKDKYEFKYFVKQSIKDHGFKVKFIKENQFIWITGEQALDRLYVFELIQGVYQENQDKTVQLITNYKDCDEFHFSIIYNKERNLIVVRHKKYIYIIREINDGNYKIEDQLNFDTYYIYGNITNNGKYLVCWDAKREGYSTYELLNI